MNNTYKKIFREIKKYDNIVIARHIGPDPDALGSQFALKEVIKNTFPNKNVYAVGNPASKFKFLGTLDKTENITYENCLLIVLDTPDIKRIDSIDLRRCAEIIKIDHHPFIEKYGDIEYIDANACSTSQLILEFILENKLKLTKSIAEKIYLAIVSDTDRFLHDYTSLNTFKLVATLIEKTSLDFTSLYKLLYSRPYNEIKFQGYIYQNLTITENGLAYIKLTDELMKEYSVDISTAGNIISDLKYVDEILIWVFFSEDKKSELIKGNIRSVGPVINELISTFGGGGHKFASGVRVNSWDKVDEIIVALDNLAKEYKDSK